MRCFTVSVDYGDLLEASLAYNANKFAERVVVTHKQDTKSIDAAAAAGCRVHITDAFYRGGALFAKWAALEEALDVYGRHGCICFLDADVFLPKRVQLAVPRGYLLSPLRRMADKLVSEDKWRQYPVHRNVNEHAGYCQLFHGDDPVLPSPPWHDTRWLHAGGADSFFQAMWPKERRVRPTWECLHVGEAGVNWAGVGNGDKLRDMMRGRREGRGFAGELGSAPPRGR